MIYHSRDPGNWRLFLRSLNYTGLLDHHDDGRKWVSNLLQDFRPGRNRFAGILLQECDAKAGQLIDERSRWRALLLCVHGGLATATEWGRTDGGWLFNPKASERSGLVLVPDGLTMRLLNIPAVSWFE